MIVSRPYALTRAGHDTLVARYVADGLEIKARDEEIVGGWGSTTLVRPGVEDRSRWPWWRRIPLLFRVESAVVYYPQPMGKRWIVRL